MCLLIKYQHQIHVNASCFLLKKYNFELVFQILCFIKSLSSYRTVPTSYPLNNAAPQHNDTTVYLLTCTCVKPSSDRVLSLSPVDLHEEDFGPLESSNQS
jgi:hypothetical protein